MLNLTINATGANLNAIELAVEEALRLIREHCLSGMDRADDGSFDFQLTGEEEPASEEKDS